MATVKLSELVLDWDLYPRHNVSSVQVAAMIDHLKAGGSLPPIIVCRKTKRIVDGFHRHRAWLKMHGDDFEAPVEWRDFKNDGELFKEAARNATGNSLNLSPFDRVRCLSRAKALRIPVADMAAILRMTTARAKSLLEERTASSAGGQSDVVVKRSIPHMAGETLTAKQEEANEKASGWSPLFHVNQLISHFENFPLNPETAEKLAERCEVLVRLIEEKVLAAK